MVAVSSKRLHAILLCLCWILFVSKAQTAERLNGDAPKVRGVSLGGWLVVEGWIKHSIFDDIPEGDLLDGSQVQFKSVALGKYITAENGGGHNVSVNKQIPASWETFKLWRVSEAEFQFRSSGGQFLSCDGEGTTVTAKAKAPPSATETFHIKRSYNKVHIRLSGGTYLQATSSNQLKANYPGNPGWDDNNTATFEMTVVSTDYHGEYQLANGYGPDKAKEVLKRHRSNFITADDFKFLSKQGINTVRIPVGWWIAKDPNPPAPFVGGSLAALDNAFSWAQGYNMKCIISLHAAPGSQNGKEHSATRDGSLDWAASPEYISQSLDVIHFLASRYAKHPALLGISVLDNPFVSGVPLNVLVSYYKRAYQIVRNYSSTAYVIVSQRIGKADPIELFQANIGSSNLVVDIHYYNRDNLSVNSTVKDNIEFVHKSRQAQIDVLNSANGPLVFIGEWVNDFPFENASQADYRNFGKAQLGVYSTASFGWAYWTLKNEVKPWDLEWNIQNDRLQIGDSPTRMIPGRHIIFLGLLCQYYFLHKTL